MYQRLVCHKNLNLIQIMLNSSVFLWLLSNAVDCVKAKVISSENDKEKSKIKLQAV